MGIKAAKVVVPATTPSTLMTQDTAGQMGQVGESLAVAVPAGAATIYLGGSDVTTASGYPLAAGESITIDAAPGETLCVSVLYQGV